MVQSTQRSGSWGSLGGGGLLVGGLLLLIGAFLHIAELDMAFWFSAIGMLGIGLGLLFVGSGPVADGIGRLLLMVAGIAALVWGVLLVLELLGVALPVVVTDIVMVVFVVALVIGAVVVIGRGSASGAAKWILVLPAIAAVLLLLDRFLDISGGTGWPWLALAVLTLVAGLMFLVNRSRVTA